MAAILIYRGIRYLIGKFCGPSKPDDEQQPTSDNGQTYSQGYPPQTGGKHSQYKPPHGQQGPYTPPTVHGNYLVNDKDPQYRALRDRANQEGDAMARCFSESQQAYERGDGALAKQLSDEGKSHKAEMENLNDQASQWIFDRNNEGRGPGEVDLHGLYVKEAITRTERAIQEAQRRNLSEIKLIVGKGLHSENHVAKIKPAIEELMQRYKLLAELDSQNEGELIVYLNGQGGVRGRAVNADDIANGLEKEGSCTIM